jgi:hypothetical protein
VPEWGGDEGANAACKGGFHTRVVVYVGAQRGRVVLDRPDGEAVLASESLADAVLEVAARRADDELVALDQRDGGRAGSRELLRSFADQGHLGLQVQIRRRDVALDLDDPREATGLRSQRVLRALAGGDVPGVAERADDLAAGISERHP